MENVKVMCINLHMIEFMYVLITPKEIKIRHMENHMYWEEKKKPQVCSEILPGQTDVGGHMWVKPLTRNREKGTVSY